MNYYQRNIKLSPKNKRYLNTVRHDNIDYVLTPLSNSSRGGNSNVFNIEDPNDNEIRIIKFCKYDLNNPNKETRKRIARFAREIEALQLLKKNDVSNIISFEFDDYKDISKYRFHFYVMEKADYDLSTFFRLNDVSIQQRFLLCMDILEGIKELHRYKIYHRDIKPDNILFVNKTWKIGDLGLIDYRNSDFQIEEDGDKIGPIGWLSPEATNKFLVEGNSKKNPYDFDCELDEYSDIFQLGKLFWYIFQGNIPLGQIRREDFKIKDKTIYDILIKMLMHSKDKRFQIGEIEDEFRSRSSHYGL